MRVTTGTAPVVLVVAAWAAALLGAPPAAAQQREYSLFDQFSVAAEFSWASMDTRIRLDSEVLGVGTEIDFESDGGLSSSKATPSLSIDWNFGRHRRSRLGGWWLNVDRGNVRQILDEIRFGDEVFPIDETVRFSFGVEELGLAYTYFTTIKPRWVVGFGGGLRTLRVSAGLQAVGEVVGPEVTEEGNFTGPLPFGWIEVRYGITPKLRLVGNLGVFYIEIFEYTGSQVVLDGYIEHLTFKNVAFGGGVRGGRVDVTVDANAFTGEAKLGIFSVRGYIRFRF